VRFLSQSPLKIGGMEKLNSCAIVGNSGHILEKPYGKSIDNHDMVVRFNTLPTAGYTKKVGARTTFRFLNHARSFAVCHAPAHVLPEYNTTEPRNNEIKGFILWHPNEREKAKECLDKRFADRLKVIALSKYVRLPPRLARADCGCLLWVDSRVPWLGNPNDRLCDAGG
jgi:hypothetical protein